MAMEQSPLYRKVARAPNTFFFGKRAVFYGFFPVDYPQNTPLWRPVPQLPWMLNYPKHAVFYD